MTIKHIYAALQLLFVTAAATAQSTVTIQGEITGDTKGYNKIYLYGKNVPQDSTTIADGHFSFSFPYVNGCTPLLYSEYDIKVKHGVSPFVALIDGPGTIKLQEADITKGLQSGTWSGNQSAVDYQVFNLGIESLTADIGKTLEEKYPGLSYKDSAYAAARAQLFKEKTGRYLLDFIAQHPNSYASAAALRAQRIAISEDDMEKAFGLLSVTQQRSAAGKDVATYIEALKKTAIGQSVADFTLPTPAEKSLSFSSLKGKYVVVDFWASWCGPCKASFPKMKALYARYKSDRFEICSISIDQDKAAWLKELEKQALPWLQVLDTKNVSKEEFAVMAVPTMYLISPDGTILLKEIGFNGSEDSPLNTKLHELFPEL